MVRNPDFQCIFHKPADIVDPGIAEFDHFSCGCIDKMVVLLELVRPFELCTVVAELVFGDQAAVEQQFDGIV